MNLLLAVSLQNSPAVRTLHAVCGAVKQREIVPFCCLFAQFWPRSINTPRGLSAFGELERSNYGVQKYTQNVLSLHFAEAASLPHPLLLSFLSLASGYCAHQWTPPKPPSFPSSPPSCTPNLRLFIASAVLSVPHARRGRKIGPSVL